MYKIQLLIANLLFLCTVVQGQTSVEGTVSDNLGNPLLGVTVQVQNSRLGAVSDENGYFKITRIRPGKYQLEVSSLGFRTRIVPVEVNRGEEISLSITLSESNEELDEVIVQGKTDEQRQREEPIKVEVISVEQILEQAS
ncbi:MAG: carboxypeptidase-like regulatory domain-containing protein, partial [Bacteroidota bacterium]